MLARVGATSVRIDPAVAGLLLPWFPQPTLEGVRIVQNGPVCWFVRAVLRQGAMTVAPYVFFGRSRYDPARLASIALLAHEIKHVEQYQRYGHVRFLLLYVWHLARNRFRYSRNLPLEAEAYTLQSEVRATLESRFV